MSYNTLIRNWHLMANQDDYFSKFTFEYLAFIAFLRKEKFRYETSDRSTIQCLKSDEEVRDRYLQIVRADHQVSNSWCEIIEELKRSPLANDSRDNQRVEITDWWNCDTKNSNQKRIEDIQLPSGVIHDLSDWRNMVEFWYSVRNNLFHGAKDPDHERDQLVVKYGFKTLRPLVELFLTEIYRG
jgi:hypothetical protein